MNDNRFIGKGSWMKDMPKVVIEEHDRQPPPLPLRIPLNAYPSPIEGLDVSRFPLPMRIESRIIPAPYADIVVIEVTTYVKDRLNPELMIDVVFSERFNMDLFNRIPHEELLYGIVRRLVLHELDECWLVHGQRVHDPHKDGRDRF
jgi:hypothetical protein